jgi:hypothetical protein
MNAQPTAPQPVLSKSMLKQQARMARRMERQAPKKFQQFLASGERTQALMFKCINESPFLFRAKLAVATLLGRLPDGH